MSYLRLFEFEYRATDRTKGPPLFRQAETDISLTRKHLISTARISVLHAQHIAPKCFFTADEARL
jgi:hypothetical protein